MLRFLFFILNFMALLVVVTVLVGMRYFPLEVWKYFGQDENLGKVLSLTSPVTTPNLTLPMEYPVVISGIKETLHQSLQDVYSSDGYGNRLAYNKYQLKVLNANDWKTLEHMDRPFSLVLNLVILKESDMVRLGRIAMLKELHISETFVVSNPVYDFIDKQFRLMHDTTLSESGYYFEGDLQSMIPMLQLAEVFAGTPLFFSQTTDYLLRMNQLVSLSIETPYFRFNQQMVTDRFSSNEKKAF